MQKYGRSGIQKLDRREFDRMGAEDFHVNRKARVNNTEGTQQGRLVQNFYRAVLAPTEEDKKRDKNTGCHVLYQSKTHRPPT